MAAWLERSTTLLEPLADAIAQIVRDGRASFADDTTVKMQAPGQKQTPVQEQSAPVRALG